MQQLSNYLLKLSRGALEQPADKFKDWALSEAKALIPFDTCVWFIGRWINEMPVAHFVHLHNLAGNFVENWQQFQHEDNLARDVSQHSNQTFNVNVLQEYRDTDIYNKHCKRFGIEHIVGTGSIDPDTRLINSICLYRSDSSRPFTERERSLKEILFQHLIEAARTNWLTNLPNMFSTYQRSSFNALAACDHAGLLHVAMPTFVDVCRKEWPLWKGPSLPTELLESLSNRIYVGQSVAVSILKTNELTLLRARAKTPADNLSSRELEIAKLISAGDDYKTIAINLSISPATVKTHTNNIYLKLGINDKAKLGIELGNLSY